MADTPVVIEKASDWLNLSDEQLAAEIGRPQAAEALKEAEEAVAQGVEAPAAKAPKETPAEAPEVVVPEAAAPEAAKPEALPEPPKPAYTPITKFTLKDSQGVLDEADASQSFKFDFTANKKDYTDVPLDKVVKLAQMGVYNEEREQQVQAARQFVTEAEQKVAEYEGQIAEYDQYTRRLLSDPKYFAEAQRLFYQENSPEARAQRAEAQLQQQQVQNATAAEDRQIASFVASDLTPNVVKLTQENPDVRYEEVIGRFTMLTAPLLQRGRIPTQALSEVRRLVEHELTPWVEQQQEERSRTRTVQKAQVSEAQTKAALAKRQVARKVAPPQASAPSQPKQKKYTTARAWLDDTLPMADLDN